MSITEIDPLETPAPAPATAGPKPIKPKAEPFVSTTNACKLCKPLGATLVFKGIEGGVPFLHGSQGCATYMRRYIISHFREPMDIASSSLGEKQAIYGGAANLKKGLLTVMDKYGAGLIGVATTCLTETIGDDVPGALLEFRREFADLELAPVVNVSTPSYSGSHMEGFTAAVRAVADQLVRTGLKTDAVNCFPGFVSCEDLRHLKDVFAAFELPVTLLPDYSETLDGPALEDYEKITSGGTPVKALEAMGGAPASFEFGATLPPPGEAGTAGGLLAARHGVPLHRMGLPIGLRESDAFFQALETVSCRPTPRRHALERGRLLDAFVDGHKYVAQKRCVLYGEEDLLVGLTSFMAEIGVIPVLVAGGGRSGRLKDAVHAACEGLVPEMPEVAEGVDFYDIADKARELAPDLFLGHSKGYRLARELNVPLIRVGFPIHDRFGGHRTRHLCYQGALDLLDRVVNAMIEKKQTDSDIGYGYI
ncbi:Nitrogenase molybdenum-iron protein beta chain [Fundidesulfovibrio magnetotacticus]|uniref:Nitrogenase molybdenum-iron protein beta chain n=1 Tax=Fundidesulfovibrio magnetotacticus TaxID=2730080 RepID=A0A6V8LZ60_9BACT|nr:nitrogenase component 1 [Fundidesulfovibrio magnetotacticus]GFK96080.1 Nitrogenase molybdenum-iron protein beta chain [Fundidesulfovibrio magnetotacticus]